MFLDRVGAEKKKKRGELERTKEKKRIFIIIIIGLEKQCFLTRLVFREEEKKKNGAEKTKSSKG